jgi:tetratricopeptide (TPR) repeat protein
LLETSGADDLRRRWYRATGLNLLFLEELESARSSLEEGLDLFEDDPGLLVALGATYEAEAWELRLLLRSLQAELIPVLVDLARVRAQQRHCWSDAAELYEKALVEDPEHAEAHLRLGAVELLRGRTERGLEKLQWVTERAREPDLVYLAHLFIGRERERAGDLDDALTSYRAALDADALGQAAYIATSHALRVSGRARAASDVLERGLATRRPELTRDSWWRYPRARLGGARELLTTLRGEVCP